MPTTNSSSAIKAAVEFHYDLQKVRIALGNRANRAVETNPLTDHDKAFLAKSSASMEELESESKRYVLQALKNHIMWGWLEKQKGCGELMSAVILACVDIHKCPTASSLWKYAGLNVEDIPSQENGSVPGGRAPRPRKKKKLTYNPWLRTKLVGVLASCMLKAANFDEEGYYKLVGSKKKDTQRKVRLTETPWRKIYDDYKRRKQHQVVPECMLCEGKKKIEREDEETGEKRIVKCPHCKGTGGPCAWGKSDAHRHNAAMRYMIKIFLLETWKVWREKEGLPVRVPYAEEYLGRVHHGGNGTSAKPLQATT